MATDLVHRMLTGREWWSEDDIAAKGKRRRQRTKEDTARVVYESVMVKLAAREQVASERQ